MPNKARDGAGELEESVALRYRDGDRAPVVTASGAGEVAREIVRLAREHGVPVYEDRELAQLLRELKLDTAIPPELYRAVAEVLSFVCRMDGTWRNLTTGDRGGEPCDV